MNLHEDKPLWVPSAERIAGANVTAFRRAAAQRWGVALPDYDALYDWSVAHPEQFWVSVWEGDCGGRGVIGERGERGERGAGVARCERRTRGRHGTRGGPPADPALATPHRRAEPLALDSR